MEFGPFFPLRPASFVPILEYTAGVFSERSEESLLGIFPQGQSSACFFFRNNIGEQVFTLCRDTTRK
jgi:hypothetical protein